MDDIHNIPPPKSPNIGIPEAQEAVLWEDFIVNEEFFKDEGKDQGMNLFLHYFNTKANLF